MANERKPFDSIEGSLEYIGLLREAIRTTRKTVAADAAAASAEGAARRLEALQLVAYKLERLAWHIDGSRRILNDLRTLRRLLLVRAAAQIESARPLGFRFMQYTIEILSGYMKAEMVERETAAETADLVNAIVAALRSQDVFKLLISTRKSRPVFKVEEWKLSEALDRVMSIPGLRVAFVSDTREIAMSQEYIVLLGRQRGLEFRAFGTEEHAAVAWLQGADRKL